MAGSISVLGLGSGLNLQDILDQMRQIDEAPIKGMEEEKDRLNEQLAEFDKLNSDMFDLKSKVMDLGLQSTYLKRSVSSSNEDVVTATVSDGASVGNVDLTVVRLAKISSWGGDSVSSEDYVVNSSGADETLRLHVGTGDVVSITVPDGTTLSGLAELINDAEDNPGVTARVVDTGDATNPYRLMLTADDYGEDNRIYIDQQLGGYSLSELQGAGGASLNAEMVVNGLTYQRSTNSGITDVIPGVTLNLKDVGTSTISVTEDHSNVKEAIMDMVEGLNDIVQQLAEDTGYDEEGNPAVLTGVTSAKALRSQLIDLFSAEVDIQGNDIQTLFSLGLEFDREGNITIDEATLDKALSDNFSEVRQFFLGDEDNGIQGFADTVNDRLREMTNPSTGIWATEKSAAQAKIDRIDQQIEATKSRLDRKYELLSQQFAALDSFMSEMQSMSDYLAQQFAALSGKQNQ